ncbi:phage tail protein [Jeongeupia naejangsanensis]|uniref:Phage tail protein n=1 Tax=Jeongeupia naejangsanensis TaxID=613195 RepID=A0ABS2BJF4_9NEIS|nr:phage tail protein [Jeongeupia naejangsanensis]MBM3114964.1 phage tail protein [Jeongeupia naejangsanensis]
MSQFDFAKLPAPDLVEPLDFETILARRKAKLLGLIPAEQRDNVARTLELESEPMAILLQENVYMELLVWQRINEAAVATLLAKAQRADLDNRAADYGVTRQLITPADPDAVPPIEAVWERDDRLRLRAQMALEGLSVAGPRGAYVFHALSASPHVADVKVDSPAGGDVNVYLLDDRGNGVPDAALLATVQAALSAETVRPLNDRPFVIAGTPRSFDQTISIDGVLYPEITGGVPSLDQLIKMADEGDAWPLIEGNGYLYGNFVIEGIDESRSYFMHDGTSRRIEFTIELKRRDPDLQDLAQPKAIE